MPPAHLDGAWEATLGPEIKILEALGYIVAGRRPPSDAWADPRAVGPKIQAGGALECESTNWASLGMAVVLAYVVNGWRLPLTVADADDWIWRWWERCLVDSFSGLALYREFGSRRYSIWSMLAIVVVHWLSGKTTLDRRGVHHASWAWLVSFWSLHSLAAYTKPYRPRYTDGRPNAPLSTVTGERSFIHRVAKGIGPGPIEREPCGILLGELLGGYWAQLGDGVERRIWDRCAPKSELTKIVKAPWRQLVEQIGTWGPGGEGWLAGQVLHIIRWLDGSVACVITACRGQSTAPLYALAVVKGEIFALYADSGERQKRNIEPGSAQIDVRYGRGFVSIWVERLGVRDQRRVPQDIFGHLDADTRLMELAGGSPILYHVTVGPEGAKIIYDAGDPTPTPTPTPTPIPTPEPPGGALEWARTLRDGDSGQGAQYHAACIAILLQRQMAWGELDDLSGLAGHAKQLHERLR